MSKRKIILITSAVVVIFIFIIGMVYVVSKVKIQKNSLPVVSEMQEQTKKQLEELNALRSQAGLQPLTEEQMEQQIEELNISRRESNLQNPSDEQIKKQIEELDLLRRTP